MSGKKMRRIIPAGLGAVSLATPVCAAVCPKGKGECPYPGMCFLYTDADGNSICDYTSADSAPVVADTDPATISDSLQLSSGRHRGSANEASLSSASGVNETGGINSSLDDSAVSPVVYTAAGLFIAGIVIISLYFLMRYLRKENPEVYGKIFLYAGAIPVLLALLILVNDPQPFGFTGVFADITARYSGILYMFGGMLVMAGLWLKNALSREALISVLILTSAAGFLLIVPIAPDGFYPTLLSISALELTGLGFLGLIVLVIFSLLFGRVFCAHMCPAGAIQELLSRVPAGRKYNVKDRRIPKTVRLAVFAVTCAGVFLSYDLFGFIGVSHLFALMFTLAAGVFLLILVLSVFVYRPFCTFICPYGLILSISGHFQRFGLKRTEKCIDCGKCERICPTMEAGKDDTKSECYLCGRCIETCPVDKAIVYGKRV